MSDDDRIKPEASASNVLHFPRAAEAPTPVPAPARDGKPARDRVSTTARAGLAEEADKTDLAELLERLLDERKAMDSSQSFALARNLRDLVYGLAEEGRLDVKGVANAARGGATPKEVRALAGYVAPQGVDDEAAYVAKHPNRWLAAKPSAYKKLAFAAADLAKLDRREALIRLCQGSDFWPDSAAVADDARRAAVQVVTVLRELRRPLDALFPLDRYFDLVEEQRVLPTARGKGVEFVPCDEFEMFDHEAIPAVKLAYRWPPRRRATLVVTGTESLPASGLDALLAAGAGVEAGVNRRQWFEIGVARLRGEILPVAMFSHEIVLADGPHGRVVAQAGGDRYEAGWHKVQIELDGETVNGAWQLTDPTEDEMELPSFEPPPDVTIRRLGVDFLLRPSGGWHVWRGGGAPRTGFLHVGWRTFIDTKRSRLGAEDSLAGIVERALASEGKLGGPIAELTVDYRQKFEALNRWKDAAYAEIERKLDKVRDQLVDEGAPPHDE